MTCKMSIFTCKEPGAESSAETLWCWSPPAGMLGFSIFLWKRQYVYIFYCPSPSLHHPPLIKWEVPSPFLCLDQHECKCFVKCDRTSQCTLEKGNSWIITGDKWQTGKSVWRIQTAIICQLTSNRIRARHEVEGDGMGGTRWLGGASASVRVELVQAVSGCSHVVLHLV